MLFFADRKKHGLWNSMRLKYDIINDGQTLRAAFRAGKLLQMYDDGFGPLWLHYGPEGYAVIRAESKEEAQEIVEEEIFPGATHEEDTLDLLTDQIAEDLGLKFDIGGYEEANV